MQTAQINRGLHTKSSCALHRELFLNITIMSRNLMHLPTSVNSHQDTVSHILVVHQWQVCLMHNLIRVWFSNSFLLPSSQCEAYSLHWYKHQFATKIRSISISSPCHFYFVLYCFIDFSWSPLPLRSAQSRCPPDILCPCICPYQSS